MQATCSPPATRRNLSSSARPTIEPNLGPRSRNLTKLISEILYRFAASQRRKRRPKEAAKEAPIEAAARQWSLSVLNHKLGQTTCPLCPPLQIDRAPQTSRYADFTLYAISSCFWRCKNEFLHFLSSILALESSKTSSKTSSRILILVRQPRQQAHQQHSSNCARIGLRL